MDKLKVIFRKEYDRYTNKWDVVAFMPEIRANYGKILCYAHIGQHSEADYLYYYNTVKAAPDEYEDLLKELQSIYNDVQLVVRQRICYKDLQKAWKISA